MIQAERGGLRVLLFPRLEEAGLVCAVSTAPLDVARTEDRERFVAALGLEASRVVTPRQVHRASVLAVENVPVAPLPPADGLVTRTPGLALLVRGADCGLVVVADPVRRAVGVAHAGWKGTARGVVVNLVRALAARFGTVPADCLAGIGPTITAAHYPVGPRVPAAFLRKRDWARDYVHGTGGRLRFDLPGTIHRFLAESGIPRDAVDICPWCTFAEEGLLHSFRRMGPEAGRQGLVAAWP